MNEYLWDRTGPPDPEVERLERLLAPLRHQPERSRFNRRHLIAVGAAACVVIALAGALLRPVPRTSDWIVADQNRPLLVGERLEASKPVTIQADSVGRIEVHPGSELRVVNSAPGKQTVELRQGRIEALIWAPPREFVVDTPSARAIDLGCRYELSVAPGGDGFLRVQTGWVAFQAGRNEAFIPAGAACRTSKQRGPGIPYFESAAGELVSSLERFERSRDNTELAQILASARREDGLTLWHLLGRVERAQREAVYARFAQLVPLPPSLSRDLAIRGDRNTLDECWNALGLSDADWWREWKREWR